VVEGRVEPREILNLTVMLDHEIIDGGPAARFTHRLVELIQSGYGLEVGRAGRRLVYAEPQVAGGHRECLAPGKRGADEPVDNLDGI